MDSPELLILSPNWLGDCVMAMPGLQLLREQQPEARIYIAAKKGVAPIWNSVEGITDVIVLPVERTRQFKIIFSEAGKHNLECCYVLPHSFRAALFSLVSGSKKRRGIAGGGRRFLLTDVVSTATFQGKHQSFEYAAVLCGALSLPENLPAPRLNIPLERIEAFQKQYSLEGKVAGMLPGAARGPSKQWPIARYAAAARQLLENRIVNKIVVLGSASEKQYGNEIQNMAGPDVINLCGATSLSDLPVALKACDVVVCNDSGGMHVAAAASVPVVAIFGITDPEVTGPLGDKAIVLQKSETRSRQIPRDSSEAREALSRIAVDEVVQTVAEQLKFERS